MARGELVRALDHPVFFSLVITLVVMAWMSVINYVSKRYLNAPGLAAISGG